MTDQNTAKKESHVRSIAKGFTWRIIASATIFVITYFTTGEMDLALKVTSIEFFVKIFLYYLHERAWLKVPSGSLRSIYQSK